MAFILFFSVVLVLLIIIYVIKGRSWLKAKTWPWSQRFFAWIEPIEIKLWGKSETLLKARTQMFIGLLLTVLTQAGAIDITPIMPLVPDTWEPIVRVIWNMIPMTLTVLGAIDERLRRDTTKPLELVAIAEKDMTPAVAEAVAAADAAKTEAVAVVKEAETEKVDASPSAGKE